MLNSVREIFIEYMNKTHQEFCFNDSKFIIYIENPKPPKKNKLPSDRPSTVCNQRSENRFMKFRKQMQESKQNLKQGKTASGFENKPVQQSENRFVKMKKHNINLQHTQGKTSSKEKTKESKKENFNQFKKNSISQESQKENAKDNTKGNQINKLKQKLKSNKTINERFLKSQQEKRSKPDQQENKNSKALRNHTSNNSTHSLTHHKARSENKSAQKEKLGKKIKFAKSRTMGRKQNFSASNDKSESIPLLTPLPPTIPQEQVRDIRELFGLHHLLYKQGTDYIKAPISSETKWLQNEENTNDLHKQNENDIEGKKQKQSHLKEKVCKESDEGNQKIQKLRYSSFQSQEQQQSKQQQFQYQNSFHNQRALILSYLKNVSIQEISKFDKYSKPNSEQICDNIEVDSSLKNDIQWVKISPYPCIHLYPEASIPIVPQIKCPCKDIYPFIEFLKMLYHYQPEIITRLIQPPILHVYGVWLYNTRTNNFESILVDCQFPIHHNCYNREQTNKSGIYCSTQGYPYLWLPILIKAILKSLGKIKYGSFQMKKISIQQIFTMLTGLSMQKYDGQGRLHVEKEKYMIESEEGICYLLGYKKKSNRRTFEEDQADNDEYSSFTIHSGERRTFSFKQLRNQNQVKVYHLPAYVHWFMYLLHVQIQTLMKFQLDVERNTDFTFQHPSQSIRIYLYQQAEYSVRKKKLILKIEGKLIEEEKNGLKLLKFRVKTGKYKLFIEHGQKKIHLLFGNETSNRTNSWGRESQLKSFESNTTNMCMQSSHEVRISQGEVLHQNGNGVTQDSNFYYKNFAY